MRQQLPVILVSIVLFFSIAFTLDFFSNQGGNLESYGEKISKYLQQREIDAFSLLEDSDFLRSILAREKSNKKVKSLELVLKKDYAVLIYEKDKLIFWNETTTRFSPDLFLENPDSPKFQNSLNGIYAVYYHELKAFPLHSAIIAIPLKKSYPINSPYLQAHIPSPVRIPANISLSELKSPYPIHTFEGKILCYLKGTSSLEAKRYQTLLFILYLMGFISFCLLINHLAIYLVKRFNFLAGVLFFLATIGGLLWLAQLSKLSVKFSDLKFVTQTLYTPVNDSSLGNLLLKSITLLWFVTFFHREFKITGNFNAAIPKKLIISCFNYFTMLLGLIFITRLLRILVLDSSIVFDFNNIFNQDIASFLGIFCIILLLISLFLFAHRMMLFTINIGLSLYHRLTTLGLAILISLPIAYYADLQLSIFYFLLIGLIFLSLFDLFVDSHTPGLTWLVVWIFLFAAYTTGLLFKYNFDKSQQIKLDYATVLAERRDAMAEKHLIQWISNAPFSVDSLSRPGKLMDQIAQSFNIQAYLFNNYEYNIFLLNKDSLLFPKNNAYIDIQNDWEQASPTSYPQVRYLKNHNNPYLYLVKTGLASDTNIYIALKNKRHETSKLYAELLEQVNFKGLPFLDKYDYAIFHGNQLYTKGGNPSLDLLKEAQNLEEDSWLKQQHGGRSDILFRNNNEVYVIIGKNKEDSIKPLSLFSYLFIFFLILVALLFFLNLLLRAIPKTFEFPFIGRPSLRNKIQFAVIALILGSFFIIGVVTVAFFQSSSIEYHQNRLNRKITAVVEDVEHEFSLLPKSDSLETQLKQMAQPVSKIHSMDVNLFNLQGQLISTSAPFIFDQGIIAPRINPLIQQILEPQQQGHYITQEKIGNFIFQVAYVNVHDTQGKTVAYLGLPYYSNDRNLKNDVYDFMGTMLNVYVFLLLGAGAIAIAVANSITKPISKIGEKLSLFKLGKNEPLEWKSQDEIGGLINEYNRMIEKLEESTEKLKVSEREGAWREMAKQVAHEIKNPLTPMKLSIQYLMHAYKSNSGDIEPLLKRVSHTLIEQIEGLSRIASEFSNFAKMPKAENEIFILNDLVQSVRNLYKESPDQNDGIQFSIPEEQLAVYADKGHMNRVLTNLIKNAIQAIPDDRLAEIKVALYAKNQKGIICVSDNGTGISEDMQEKVFFPNFTTKTSGMGLGLAISKSIIEAIEGKIYFRTQINEGTDFFIELPLRQMETT